MANPLVDKLIAWCCGGMTTVSPNALPGFDSGVHHGYGQARNDVRRILENHKPSIPAAAVCVYLDGDQWCAVYGDHVDLQVSPAGFGATMFDAIEALVNEPKSIEAVPA